MNLYGEEKNYHRSKLYSVDVSAQMMMMIKSEAVFE